MKVIGLTGTLGSGKSSVKQLILQKYNCYYVTLSDVIRGELEKKRGLLDRTALQDMGDEMRKKYGAHILAMLAIEYLPKVKEVTVIDGIRNPGEVEYLKNKFGKDFALIAVDAPVEVRFERTKARGDQKDPQTMEEFLELDKRDKGEGQPAYGQQVAACVAVADFKIDNSSAPEQLEQQVNEVMQKIMSG